MLEAIAENGNPQHVRPKTRGEALVKTLSEAEETPTETDGKT